MSGKVRLHLPNRIVAQQCQIEVAATHFLDIDGIGATVSRRDVLKQEHIKETAQQGSPRMYVLSACRSLANSFCTLLMKDPLFHGLTPSFLKIDFKAASVSRASSSNAYNSSTISSNGPVLFRFARVDVTAGGDVEVVLRQSPHG